MQTQSGYEVVSVGDFVAHYLAEIGVTTMFGVISIHNMPILDAIARQGRIRFVPSRGEAGAMNMADAHARVSGGLGVCITSTGTAAGNAAGAQAEALTAGSPVLHITSQVDVAYMDRDRAPIHDVPRQAEMLRGISKSVHRIWDANGVLGTLASAVSSALSAPTGPVSLEIPIDVQRMAAVPVSRVHAPVRLAPRAPDSAIADLAERLLASRRPVMWLGGGARSAQSAATELMRRGVGIVTSTNGRAVVSENESKNLGAFNMGPEAADLFSSADLMLVVGSRLRGNETRNNQMPLPRPLIQIDADAGQGGRNYPVDLFVHGDATETLERLLHLLPDKLDTDPALGFDIARLRAQAEGRLRDQLGPYRVIADVLSEAVSTGGHAWVRDVTISNSTFGNRHVRLTDPRQGVHALGGGIGQGVAMGIGAALAVQPGRKAITLLGDGGTMLGIAEMIAAVEERAPLVYVLMNDQAYGVIRNIQDAQYGSRQHFSQLQVPAFDTFCAAINMPHRRVGTVGEFEAALSAALAAEGPQLIEVDMCAIGPFAEAFAGPPAGAGQKKG
jgi:acetolactate synthase-1/2/3 large subunit